MDKDYEKFLDEELCVNLTYREYFKQHSPEKYPRNIEFFGQFIWKRAQEVLRENKDG